MNGIMQISWVPIFLSLSGIFSIAARKYILLRIPHDKKKMVSTAMIAYALFAFAIVVIYASVGSISRKTGNSLGVIMTVCGFLLGIFSQQIAKIFSPGDTEKTRNILLIVSLPVTAIGAIIAIYR